MPRYLRLLRWALAVEIILGLVILALSCVGIYAAGNAPGNIGADGVYIEPVFSYSAVGERLKPFGLLLALNILPVVLISVLQRRHMGFAPETGLTWANRLRLARSRVGSIPQEALAEGKRRCIITAVMMAVAVLCVAPAAVYLADGSNFVSWDTEKAVGSMLRNVLPWIAAAMCSAYVCLCLRDRSMQKETEILKRSMAGSAPCKAVNGKSAVNAARILLYLAAAALVVIGVLNGGARDVLIKAINICTECIGLG